MKKLLAFLLVAVLCLAACGKEKSTDNNTAASKKENTTVKVGIRSSETKTWEYIKERAAKEGIDLDLVILSAQLDPNQVLSEHEVDINAFQHVAYLDLFNSSNNTEIEPIGTTIIAPLAMYSKKYNDVSDVKKGTKIAVPNDPSNWGRALLLLQENNLLTVTDDFDGNGGEDRIKDNPYNLKIVPVEAATLPRVMDDTDFAIINNGIAFESGLRIAKDAIISEDDTAKPFINIIATNKEDVDKADFYAVNRFDIIRF